MRTISEPACASAATCFTVACASAVSVLVIDCTTTGAPPPIATAPTFTRRVSRRVTKSVDMDPSSFERDARDVNPRVRLQIDGLVVEQHFHVAGIAYHQRQRRLASDQSL